MRGTLMANTKLTESESRRLGQIEEKIERNRSEVISDFSEIRDKRLYRNYGTFEEYCDRRWGYRRNYVTKLIRVSNVVKNIENLGTMVPKAQTERVARPLTRLPASEQSAAWTEAVQTARQTTELRNPRISSSKLAAITPTARQVAAVVDKRIQTKAFTVIQQKDAPKQSEYITLDAWNQDGENLLSGFTTSKKTFNAQVNTGIEWAQWSWNPVTGCLHNCPYCYARDIAERFYPQKFEPVLLPDRLAAPHNTPVPTKAATDPAYRNVFTCSMADLFGRWVPRRWIELVLEQVSANLQWNFLFLTKFPIRMSEFEYPDNAWMGTTVDCQARVHNAERAFAKVKAKTKWLSLEPLLEPLRFSSLSNFAWVVIGGSSPSAATGMSPATPAWTPPFEWLVDIHNQARAAGCKIHYKDNC